MSVLYLGTYRRRYPRNNVLREGLRRNGLGVVEARVGEGDPHWSDWWRVWMKGRSALRQGGIDVILIPEFNHVLVPVAYALGRRYGVPVVFDPLVSQYDSVVHDRGLVGSLSLKGLIFFLVDWVSMHLCDLVLADTSEHRDYFRERFHVRSVAVVRIGAMTTPFGESSADGRRREPSGGDWGGVLKGFRVLFWGNFIPLQGVKYILAAAERLQEGPERVEFALVGDGQTWGRAKRTVDQLGLDNVHLMGRRDQDTIVQLALGADVCLGIFGDTGKARRVIPNKVYEASAMGRPIITADTPAIREVFTHGHDAYLVKRASGRAIHEGILDLAGDDRLRIRLGDGARRLYEEEFSADRVGARLARVLEDVRRDASVEA